MIELKSDEAARNMSLDQAILESVDRGGPATLRLYGWSEPTLSLGYFQSLGDRGKHHESQTLGCVRRASGGGAIVHHHELTYSIGWPIQGQSPGANRCLYEQTHLAFCRAIRDFGLHATPFANAQPEAAIRANAKADVEDPFLCFQRRTDDDLIVAGYKVLGSAQRRGRRAILQHGSLLIRASEFAPQLPGLSELGASVGTVNDIAGATVRHLEQVLRLRWNPGSLTIDEQDRAAQISAERFESESWLHRR